MSPAWVTVFSNTSPTAADTLSRRELPSAALPACRGLSPPSWYPNPTAGAHRRGRRPGGPHTGSGRVVQRLTVSRSAGCDHLNPSVGDTLGSVGTLCLRADLDPWWLGLETRKQTTRARRPETRRQRREWPGDTSWRRRGCDAPMRVVCGVADGQPNPCRLVETHDSRSPRAVDQLCGRPELEIQRQRLSLEHRPVRRHR